MASTAAVALRPFTAQDRALLLEWVRDAAELDLFSGGSLSWPLEEAEIEAVAGRPGTTAYTAVVADIPIGHLELVHVTPREARIARVLIAPQQRGKGLAKPLVTAALHLLTDAGYREVALHVIPGNAPALRSYESVGFHETAPSPAHPRFIRMERSLPF